MPDHQRFVVVTEKPCFERNVLFDFIKVIGQDIVLIKSSALSRILCKRRNAVKIGNNIFEAAAEKSAVALFVI